MKKFITVLAAICVCVLTAGMLFGCGETTPGNYTLVAPDGAPMAALADMWGENVGDTKIDYTITAESNLQTEFANGTDFIVAPINVGANIHNAAAADKTKYDYKLMNVTSWGVLYIVTTEDYKSENDSLNVSSFLKQFDGGSVTTIGLAMIPGKSVEYLFGTAEADVTLVGSDAATIQQRLKNKETFTAVLGEPAITALKKQNVDFRVLCSVSEIYNAVTGDEFPMAGMFVRSEIATADSAAMKSVNERVEVSVAKFNENPETAGNKAAAAGSTLKGAVLKDAARKMNVKFVDADASKTAVISLLQKIGIMVDDDLFV